jgi:hypothetical protein
MPGSIVMRLDRKDELLRSVGINEIGLNGNQVTVVIFVEYSLFQRNIPIECNR